MSDKEEEVFGRHLAREVYVERVRNPSTGEEIITQSGREVTEDWEGRVENIVSRVSEVDACGHLYRPGQARAVCEECSRKARQTVFVCGECAVQCNQCGRPLCKRHTRPGPNGQRYCSKRCLKKAMRLQAPSAPVCAPSRPEIPPLMREGAPFQVMSPSSRERLLIRFLRWW